MVYIGIPKNYTASPSSFAGTPSLTINHAAAQDLDSSNAFEGMSLFLHCVQLLELRVNGSTKVLKSFWRSGLHRPLSLWDRPSLPA